VAQTFSFKLVPPPGITACLPHASGRATITTGRLNDTMTVSISGMPANTEFDLFVIQVPDKPFGVAWYQSDVQSGPAGFGAVTVKGHLRRRDVLGLDRRHGDVPAHAPVPPRPVVQQPGEAVQPGLRAGGHVPDRHAVQRGAARPVSRC
jgi:hypothetical protein